MCGIIGIITRQQQVQDLLLDALKRMEYRGYDSSGICTRQKNELDCRKRSGKLGNLEVALKESPLRGSIGIGHTRWATHGAPTDANAHPHVGDKVAAVHNGIIENYQSIRSSLEKKGTQFLSETDSETIPWLFCKHLESEPDPVSAWRASLDLLEGPHAILAMLRRGEKRLWFARRGSPLLLGRSNSIVYGASDAIALSGLADEVMYLNEGEYGYISLDGCEIYDASGIPVESAWKEMPVNHIESGRDGFRHYMEKEIHEQPGVLADILQAYVHDSVISFPEATFLETCPLPDRIVMVACGTSYHAALIARYWLERFLNISVEVDVASEYRYRNPIIGSNTWLVTLSQSGETADTLEALRLFKSHTPDNPVLVLCNVAHSSLARESDGIIELLAGPEISVASTKAFTAQLMILALMVLAMARRSGGLKENAIRKYLHSLHDLVPAIGGLIDDTHGIEELAAFFSSAHGALYLGRGPCFPSAMEGALKLKEITYLHAEGYAAGEMKHGPIALVDEHLPVVVIALQQYHLEKVLSNLQEVHARGAKVILLTDLARHNCPKYISGIISIPAGDYFTAPLLAAAPLQLLAYHVARLIGTDIDQPRNLAKSVTVE
ncbi:MAG: glutamine--fructose-6-phosphate transaminase (isomerizing) [Mariprofundaceae bacterium]